MRISLPIAVAVSLASLAACNGKEAARTSGSTAAAAPTSASAPDLGAKIKDWLAAHGQPVSAVAITERVQSYPDSFRSPEDKGTTYIVKARVTLPNGTTEAKTYAVGVAASDGWTTLEEK